ncbi:MAG: type II secretory ATPase GspE/PulE/Tfp pilus assembly ATPase PilB-like protein, partial [Rhodothermales bacterium]
NDSVGAVNRLVDMGLEPFLVASSLAASLAQRLVRRICPHCKEPQTEIQDNIRLEIADVLDMDDDEIPAWQGKGCLECDETGYRGRVAVYEFFLMNEDLADSVARGGTTTELRAFAIRSGMITLRQDGWRKVAAGLTTIKEIQRITSSCDVHY